MTAAAEWIPSVAVPLPEARPAARPHQLATVTVLSPPSQPPVAAPIRLTRRGVIVVAALVAALGVGLIWLGRLSAPASPAGAPGPATVTVQPGDTLWSIAGRVAPGRDPLAEVSTLQQRNHLTGVDLVPGQVLQVR
jgi:Tfp pilus assembly protein FimV